MTVPLAPNSTSSPADDVAADAQRDGPALRVRHLRRDRAHPDQLVERELVARQLAAATCCGVRKESPAGRIASCASCAFLTLRS